MEGDGSIVDEKCDDLAHRSACMCDETPTSGFGTLFKFKKIILPEFYPRKACPPTLGSGGYDYARDSRHYVKTGAYVQFPDAPAECAKSGLRLAPAFNTYDVTSLINTGKSM